MFNTNLTYHHPFSNNNTYSPYYFDEEDHGHQSSVDAMFVKFAIDNGILRGVNDNVIISLPSDANAWQWKIAVARMTQIVSAEHAIQFMQHLKINDSSILDKFNDLNMRLGITYPHYILDELINRMYRSLAMASAAAYVDEYNEGIMDNFPDIHKKLPFFWVIIYLQVCIRNVTTLIPVEE